MRQVEKVSLRVYYHRGPSLSVELTMDDLCNRSPMLQLVTRYPANACVESYIQTAMLLAQQSVLNGSKVGKCKDFFVCEFSFSTSDDASLAL